ncbi:hypothetical protein [Rubritalea marina]|uniref:glycosyl-4,4'-diaponeurosporenoate acyltransferase CrtO family protein n=1 Tax=Rubritalea marina TaxID=361055 RepID=UPI0003677BD3|nr:hypothetical protein [Rubritalea marina]
MLLELPALWIAVLNVVLIPVLHLGFAWLSLQLPQQWFQLHHNPAHEPSQLYTSLFRVHQWKNILPDGAPWLGGPSKSGIKSHHKQELQQFLAECRRGQFAHWLQALAISTLVIYNPTPANWIILIYAQLSNLPCILNLRHTELRLRVVLFDTK